MALFVGDDDQPIRLLLHHRLHREERATELRAAMPGKQCERHHHLGEVAVRFSAGARGLCRNFRTVNPCSILDTPPEKSRGQTYLADAYLPKLQAGLRREPPNSFWERSFGSVNPVIKIDRLDPKKLGIELRHERQSGVRPCAEKLHFRKMVEDVFTVPDNENALSCRHGHAELDMTTTTPVVALGLLRKGDDTVGGEQIIAIFPRGA